MGNWQQVLAWFQKECTACAGSGIAVCNCNEHNEIVCPDCMGKGVIDESVTASQVIEVPCDQPDCQNGTVPCSVCGGTGKNANGEACSVCHGKGRVECPLCHGIGRIKRMHQEQWIAHKQCPTCGGRRYVPCPHCHGTKNRICPVCQGKGKVWNKGRIGLVGAIALILTIMPGISLTIIGFALVGMVLYLACQYFPPQSDDADEGQNVDKKADK